MKEKEEEEASNFVGKSRKNDFHGKQADGSYRYVNHFGGKYDMYGSLTLGQVFTTKTIGKYMKKSENARKGKLRDLYATHTNASLAARVYGEYLRMMVDDVISGDMVTIFSHKQFPAFRVGFLSEKESDSFINNDGLKKHFVNILNTDYRIPRLMLDYGPNSRYTSRVLHVSTKKFDEMLENINNGKMYIKPIENVKKDK